MSESRISADWSDFADCAPVEMIFTWDLNIESFNKIREQPNLIDLRSEFEMRKYSLSRSLLIWEKNSGDGYSLSDIGNKKFYHIIKNPDEAMEIWEDDWNSVTLRIPPLNYEVHGTYEGFIDWLTLIVLIRIIQLRNI